MSTDLEAPGALVGTYEPRPPDEQFAEAYRRIDDGDTRSALAALRDGIASLDGEVGRLTESVRAAQRLEEAVARLAAHVAELQATVEDVIAAGPPREDAPATVEAKAAVRVRVAHAHTKADGWRCSETTAEWCGPAPADGQLLAAEMRRAYLLGHVEANYRNEGPAAAER